MIDIETNIVYGALLIINLLLVYFGARVAKNKYKTLLSPVFVYSVLWGGALVLIITDFSADFFRPEPFTLVLIQLSVLSFILGSFSVRTTGEYQAGDKKEVLKSLMTLYGFVAPIAILLCGTFLAFVINKYGLDFYINHGAQVHVNMLGDSREDNYPFGKAGFRVVQFFVHPLVYFSAVLGGGLVMHANKVRLIYFLPIVSSMLYDLAIVGRFRTYITLMVFVFAFLLKRKHLPHPVRRVLIPAYEGKKVLLLFLTVMVLLYGSMALLRSYYVDVTFDVWGYRIPSVIFQPIRYLIGGIYAFSHSYQSYGDLRYGMELIYPFVGKPMKYIGLDVFPYEYILENVTQIGSNQYILAFYTYLFVAYRDFGVFGMVFYPFMLGVISGKVFFKAWRDDDPLWSINSLFVLGAVIAPSTINWALTDFSGVVALFYLILLSIWGAKKRGYNARKAKPF